MGDVKWPGKILNVKKHTGLWHVVLGTEGMCQERPLLGLQMEQYTGVLLQ